jgi:membrane protein required for colicin V production
MSYIDLIIAVPIVWGAIIGFKKGLIIEVFSLVALIGGIYCAMEFSFMLIPTMNEYVSWSDSVIQGVAFLMTFVIVVLAVRLLARGIQAIAKMAALGMANRVLGGLFGGLKFMTIVAVLLYFTQMINEKYHFIKPKTVESSLLYKPLSELVPLIYPRIMLEFEGGEEKDQSIMAAIPGKVMPSRYSIKAPPPVEM